MYYKKSAFIESAESLTFEDAPLVWDGMVWRGSCSADVAGWMINEKGERMPLLSYEYHDIKKDVERGSVYLDTHYIFTMTLWPWENKKLTELLGILYKSLVAA